ncbi:MAG: isoleucine--tRNA ligase [Patescibacteria group bacterium]
MSDEPKQQSGPPNFPKIEEEIAEFWKKKKIFERSIEERPENKTYVFYDGPPFANGLPHYGHLLQSAIKDAVPRYFTMQGYRVPRRWGWDCHGLPVENLIEKELKLNSKRDIESFGIDKFNQACRESVMKYAADWKKYIERFGRWVQFDGAYKTMDASYIESVWWVFAELWKKNLIYKDLRVSLFCPRCSTPLSNTEIAMGNHYIDVEDPAVTIKFKLKGEPNTYLLAWTTTPWTLPANMALAVHPDSMYLKVKMYDSGETYIFAEGLKTSVMKDFYPLKDEDVPFEIITKLHGKELVGLEYEPLYPLPEAEARRLTERPGKNQFQVVAMDYVSVTDGTGIVHTAPAFGEEDFAASKEHDIPVLVTVDDEGKQKTELALVGGMKTKSSDSVIMEDLKKRGLLFKEDKITHSVPVCWRCSTPLLYKAQKAWFVDVTKLKSKMLEAAKKINWHPEHFKTGRFGKGLESAPDWCVSRTRFWGAPLPVWQCDKCDEIKVFSSVAELSEASQGGIKSGKDLDLHRPGIDVIKMDCKCGGQMSRTPDVFDCWFESGSMPYAAGHYPFENKNRFDENFPADFIAEAQDQTRGWFYTLHVLATALFGKPAFKNVIATGIIMAEDGKKMSKSLKNYPDPWELMTRLGADSLRFYLLSSPVIQAEQLNFSEKDCETLQRALLGILWNVRAFYLLYAEGQDVELVKPRSAHVLDRWLISRMMQTIQEATRAMETYDLVAAARPLRDWVDDFSTWWLRRSRGRFKGDNEFEKMDALRTAREALLQTSAIMAPFTPFFAEKLYQDVNGPKMSVHLDKWPKTEDRVIDEQLLADMELLREVVAKAHEARASAKIPVRQALSSLTLLMRDPAEAARLSNRSDLLMLVKEELNVERVILNGDKNTGEDAWIVELDTELTPELKKKGMAREVSRRVMNLRKKLGLTPQDVIVVAVSVSDQGFRDTIESLSSELMKDTRASSFSIDKSMTSDQEASEELELDGIKVTVGIKRV